MMRSLASKITNSQIDTDTWYELTLQTGAYGGELCVTGVGIAHGIAQPSCHSALRIKLYDLREKLIRFEPHDVRTVIQIPRDYT